MKTCCKCKLELPLSEYGKNKSTKDGYTHECKSCISIRNKKYKRSDKGRAADKRHRETDKRQSYIREYQRSWAKQKYHEDLDYKLKQVLRNHNLRLTNYIKSGKNTPEVQEFKEHMENLFADGMSWDNHGDWHIDHIIPLSKGGTNCTANLQPLWATDNLKKSNKMSN